MKLDTYDTKELFEIFTNSNTGVIKIIQQKAAEFESLIDKIVESIKQGGRVFYIGAGTSGRIGMLDALDVLPTFGENNWFKYSMAGGDQAILQSLEGYEDDFELGYNDAKKNNISNKDVLIGLSASGNTKYVKGFLTYAKEVKGYTALIANFDNGSCVEVCDKYIFIPVGQEVILGSTRLKSATAQKIILNNISSITAIKLNKVYDQYMINLTPINIKLQKRSIDMIVKITNCDYQLANSTYNQAEQNIPLAIIMIKNKVDLTKAKKIYQDNDFNLRKCIE
ncbi:N-acetylmuramic acid 6-phosphate etherase [Mycoplasma sp. NEAQ87857]|uniref:N-acetylmuramic acid 6-phosphate etherase n=1 Tax=Mycoplasma sp. NEAQ87857 TaxID=2683967 RepID=UPI0013176AE2|nr:N-acetylmuramic acid 6-phosphate etherase [Mycoplasma sp. NEAQ87857]QGZ97581.1 N-acetylmuramic acid 6-phosphate etherase [Mycoplasma sp. NEAQ87857]